MPKVNRVTGPEVSAQANRTFKQSALSPQVFENGALKGALAGGSELAAALEETQKENWEADATNAVLGFETDRDNIMLSPEGGYLNTQTKAARDGAEGTKTKISEIKQQHSKGLSPYALKIYDRITNQHVLSNNRSIDQHAAKGAYEYNMTTQDAVIQNSIKNASSMYASPDTVATKEGGQAPSDWTIMLFLGEDAVKEKMRLQGIEDENDPSVIEAVSKYEATMHASRIQGAISADDPKIASELFSEYSAMLEPDVKEQLRTAIEEKTQEVAIKDNVERITAAGGELSDRIAAAKEIADRDVKAAVMEEVETQYLFEQRVNRADQVSFYSALSAEIRTGQRTKPLTNEEIGSLEGNQAQALKDQLRAFKIGEEPITDNKVYTDLLTMSDKDFVKIDLAEYADQLDFDDYARVEASWIVANNAVNDQAAADKDRMVRSGLATRQSVMSDAVEKVFGEDLTAFSEADELGARVWVADLRGALANSLVKAEEANGNKELTETQYTDHINTFIYDYSEMHAEELGDLSSAAQAKAEEEARKKAADKVAAKGPDTLTYAQFGDIAEDTVRNIFGSDWDKSSRNAKAEQAAWVSGFNRVASSMKDRFAMANGREMTEGEARNAMYELQKPTRFDKPLSDYPIDDIYNIQNAIYAYNSNPAHSDAQVRFDSDTIATVFEVQDDEDLNAMIEEAMADQGRKNKLNVILELYLKGLFNGE